VAGGYTEELEAHPASRLALAGGQMRSVCVCAAGAVHVELLHMSLIEQKGFQGKIVQAEGRCLW
jgi:hypothetical protein